MNVHEIKQGDMTRLQFTLIKKSDKTPLNLTDTTCTLVIAGGNVYSKITRTCTINDAANGKCYYDLLTADTSGLAGTYRLEVKVDGAKDYTTLENAVLIVKEVL